MNLASLHARLLGIFTACITPTQSAFHHAVHHVCRYMLPHRFSYRVDDTSCPNVEGLIARSSRNLYRLCLNLKSSNLRRRIALASAPTSSRTRSQLCAA